jgi:hypothetical protein
MESLRAIEVETGLRLEAQFVETLGLGHAAGLAHSLRRIHALVASRFPEPHWPAAMPASTIFEYRYSLSAEELEWRLRVAAEMAEAGEHAAAAYYLRFWAYTLICIPMVHAQAEMGRGVSFLRPGRAFLPLLRAACPEVIDDVAAVMGGERGVTRGEVERGLVNLAAFRALTVNWLRDRAIDVGQLRPWTPFQPLVRGADSIDRAVQSRK